MTLVSHWVRNVTAVYVVLVSCNGSNCTDIPSSLSLSTGILESNFASRIGHGLLSPNRFLRDAISWLLSIVCLGGLLQMQHGRIGLMAHPRVSIWWLPLIR